MPKGTTILRRSIMSFTKSRLSYYPPPSYSSTPNSPPPPHPFLPLLPPPPSTPPTLPLRAERPSPIPGFTLSRHIVPAAYPRSVVGASISIPQGKEKAKGQEGKGKQRGLLRALDNPFGPVTGRTKEERRDNIVKAAKRCLKNREGKDRWVVPTNKEWDGEGDGEAEWEGEEGLWISVNRLVRDGVGDKTSSAEDGEGVSLVLCHANGFHKEMWEPTLRKLVQLEDQDERTGTGTGTGTGSGAKDSKTGARPRIDEIWLIDGVNHSESYDLNQGRVGDVYSWQDGGRDALSLLLHCLPSEEHHSPLKEMPTVLEFNPKPREVLRVGDVRRKRKWIGLGHSIGGNSIVQAAHASPNLFDSLILVDPMTRQVESTIDPEFGLALNVSCIGRRDVWSSREDARENLLRSPYFGVWDKEVFEVFLSHGLVPIPIQEDGNDSESIGIDGKGEQEREQKQGVMLSTPKWIEAAVFSDPQGSRDGWAKLVELRKDMRVRFVMAGDASATGGKLRTRSFVWRPSRSRNVILSDSSHLIVQERPMELAEQIWIGLKEELDDRDVALGEGCDLVEKGEEEVKARL